jgi:cyclohexa-1,5-dienecarbonyl-CoA hydratase
MPTVELKIAGDLAQLTLRRPPFNYLSLELLQEVESSLDSLGDAPGCRALVLDAEGKAFSAGLDIADQTRERIFLLMEEFHRVAVALLSFPRPTIAVVRGMALGAGNELVACCDLAIASEGASFGQPEIKLGSIPSLAPILLPPLIGERRTLELMLGGDLITAKEAQHIGLIQGLAPENRLREAVEVHVKKYRRLSLAVIAMAVELARAPRLRRLNENLCEVESLYLNRLMELEDYSEGMRAFAEKRAPRWQDR